MIARILVARVLEVSETPLQPIHKFLRVEIHGCVFRLHLREASQHTRHARNLAKDGRYYRVRISNAKSMRKPSGRTTEVTMEDEFTARQRAITLRLSGRSIKLICSALGRSEFWFYKWWRRYLESGAEGLYDLTRANHHVAQRI